jgi:hypothetical protein
LDSADPLPTPTSLPTGLPRPTFANIAKRGAEKAPLSVGMIIGFVAAGLVLLVLLCIIIVPYFERRKEKARIKREGKPGDIEAPSQEVLEARLQRSGSTLVPVQPRQAPEMVQMPVPQTAQMVAVPLTPATNPANPFNDPQGQGQRAAPSAPAPGEDPFADEVAAMQERLKEKFKVAQDRFRS